MYVDADSIMTINATYKGNEESGTAIRFKCGHAEIVREKTKVVLALWQQTDSNTHLLEQH
jgi:hypothetical protein